MELGSVTAATIFMRPPQAGHSVTSRFHTLDKSTAQVNLCRRWAGDESLSLVLPGGYPHFLFSPRHNLRPVGRMERQHAVVAHQIQAGWRHRRHQFLQQLVWRRSAASTQVAACREKPREEKHNGPLLTPSSGSISRRRTRCPARSPVATCPWTEAAVIMASRGSASHSGSTLTLFQQTTALQQAHHALGRGLNDLPHVVIAQLGRPHEDGSPSAPVT